MNNKYQTFLPSEKKSDREKNANNKQWYKDHIEYGKGLITAEGGERSVRQSFKTKKINYDIYADIINVDDYKDLLEPMEMSGSMVNSIQNHPIINPKLTLLQGEELNRAFDWRCVAINEDAVSSKEAKKLELLRAVAIAHIESDNVDNTALKAELTKLDKYLNYEYQDIAELTSTRILTYLYERENLKTLFNQGFLDALLVGEEIYKVDIIAGEPKVRKVDPLKIYVHRAGDSSDIEDSDMIFEIDYLPIGTVIDTFHEDLNIKQIAALEDQTSYKGNDKYKEERNTNMKHSVEWYGIEHDFSSSVSNEFGSPYDLEGNVRVLRCSWRGRRKLYQRTYLDSEGQSHVDYKSANYVAKKDEGEKIKELWVNEWYESVELGDEIYVNMNPKEVQIRSNSNISKCSSGYVGTFYNTNSSKAISMMDRARPFLYQYNVFMHKLMVTYANDPGSILQIDTAYMPDGWKPDKWFFYMKNLKMQVVDSRNEGIKPGMNNATNGYLQGAAGQDIAQIIGMLEYLENQISVITGITEQRQGNVSNRETVGGIERSVTQSSHITEPWYYTHDQVKKRVMSVLLEYAKYAYADEDNKIIPHITDDLGVTYLKLNGKDIVDSDIGIFITDSSKNKELIGIMKQLGQSMIQNDKINASTLIDIYSTNSISSMRRKIERVEQLKDEQIAEQQKQASEIENAKLQAESQSKEADRTSKENIEAAKIEKDILIEQMKLEYVDGTQEEAKLRLEELKQKQQNELDKLGLTEEIRSNKAKEDIDRQKIRTSNKV